MADTVSELVANVKTEGGFDATDAQCLNWLNRRWRLMVSEARALRKSIAVGNTVAGTAFYAFPVGTIEAYSFEVAGIPYNPARRKDIYPGAQGTLRWTGEGGLIVADSSSAGVWGVTLIPTPTAIAAITSYAAVRPADLTSDATGDALLAAVLEGDFHDELVAGAIATGLKRLERRADEAGPFEADFAQGTERLRLKVRRRFRGGGPTMMRVGWSA